MCGIVGIVGKSNVNQALYDALTVLQHRGQDAAGIVTSHDGRLFLRKDNGWCVMCFISAICSVWSGQFDFGRSPAVLRQLALRHHVGA